jgi:hypothetical protein
MLVQRTAGLQELAAKSTLFLPKFDARQANTVWQSFKVFCL